LKERAKKKGVACKPLVEKGCGDHIMSLCVKEWEKRVAKKVGKEWWNLKPMQSPHDVRTYLNQFTSTMYRISRRFGREWEGKWEGFMQWFGLKGKPIRRVTRVRFVSTDRVARQVLKWYAHHCTTITTIAISPMVIFPLKGIHFCTFGIFLCTGA